MVRIIVSLLLDRVALEVKAELQEVSHLVVKAQEQSPQIAVAARLERQLQDAEEAFKIFLVG